MTYVQTAENSDTNARGLGSVSMDVDPNVRIPGSASKGPGSWDSVSMDLGSGMGDQSTIKPNEIALANTNRKNRTEIEFKSSSH